jgi:hydroxysqualene dehydroxylase
MPFRIAIIGGGWAGLACAVELVKVSGTVPDTVDIFEAAPQFGGRARGLKWRGHTIDNGQHLAIGAYTQTQSLLKTVNAPAWSEEPLRWAGVSEHARLAQDWQVPNTAWPARVTRAVVPGNGPRGWPLKWKLSAAKQLWKLHSQHWQLPREPALRWLSRANTPQDLIAHFWQPLIEGALNTPISIACAQTVGKVLRDSLAGPQGATTVLQPPRNLSLDGVDPICSWLMQRDVSLHANHRALAVHPSENGTIQVSLQAGASIIEKIFDRVVIALPHEATLSLWERSTLRETPAVQRLRQLETSAITTVWIELSEHEQQRLAELPSWFVLNPLKGTPHLAQVAVKRGDVLALVISAQLSAEDRISKETHDQALREQLEAQLGLDSSSLPQKWITEKQATWACTPQSPIASLEEAQGHTGIDNLFRCADDLEPGYPATIESVVRSGVRCAQSIKRSM